MTVDEFKNQLAALNSEMTIEDMQRQIVANEARIAELTRLKDELAEDASLARQRAEAAEAQLANDYYKRRTRELAVELDQLRAELASVLETAIIRGEKLGYTTADDDYRARLRELGPDVEILHDETCP